MLKYCRPVIALLALKRIVAVTLLVTLAMAAQSAQPGQSAPAWVLADAAGRSVSYPQHSKGKPSILFFWATWCPYCHRMMPHLQQIQQDYEELDIQVYAVDFQDDADPVAHMAERDYNFIVLPEGDAVAEQYAVRGAPGLFIVDAQGVIMWRRGKGGSKPGSAADLWNDQMREMFDALLDEEG